MMDSRRWRLLWQLLVVVAAAAARAQAQIQSHDADTFSMPVSYSMAAPSSAAYSAAAPAKKSAVLHHFKSIRGSTSTTARYPEDDGGVGAASPSSPTPPRYSSSYNSQRVQLQVQPNSQPAAKQDEQSLMQVQQSYQSLHDYQALNKNSYQNLASLQDQSQQQTYYGYQQAAQQQHQAYQDQAYLQQAYQQSQQQQAYQQSQQQPSDQQSQQQQTYQQSQQQQAYQQSQQQPSDRQSQQQQTYQQSQQQQAYQDYQQKVADQQKQSQDYQDYQQKVADRQKQSQDYQQKLEQEKQQQDEQSEEEDDEHQKLQGQAQQKHQETSASTYTPNVLSYVQGLQGSQGQAAAGPGSSGAGPQQSVENAVSIAEAVAAAAAVTQTPELPPLTADEAQRIFAQQQQEMRLQHQQQQQQQPQLQQPQPPQLQQDPSQQQFYVGQFPQQQPTTAAYERFYEAVAATGVTPNPYLMSTPGLGAGAAAGVPARAGVLPHFKQAVSPAVSPAMQAAMTYYKNGYYADPALLQHLNRAPYRRISGPAPRPYARPRPHAHAHPHAHPHAHAHVHAPVRGHPHAHHPHTHVVPFSRYKSSPTVQHFFHGPYTMESPALAAAPAGAASDSWIEHALSPAVKRDDSLLSGLGSPPGSSTALLNGLLVPIVLLGLSIPALGFAYTYLSRRRAFDTDVTSFVQNLRPNEETVDYYFNVLQNAIECFNDPKRQHCE